MIPTQNIALAVPSHPRFLQMVRAVVEKTCEILDQPLDLTHRIVLAVDEASSNIIKHAYDNDPDGRLEFFIELRENRLDISITDYGRPCDIRLMKPRDLEDIRPGGLGVYIISEVMDKVTYTCGEQGRNIIKITKFFPNAG